MVLPQLCTDSPHVQFASPALRQRHSVVPLIGNSTEVAGGKGTPAKRGSINFDLCRFDHDLPTRNFPGDMRAELGRRNVPIFGSFRRQPLGNVGGAHDRGDLAMEPFRTGAGMPAGATRPYHCDASKSLIVSATAGISGATASRLVVDTPRPRSVPARTCCNTDSTPVMVTCTWPAMRSPTDGAVPRYGTCVIVMPAARLNAAMAIWAALPWPADE